MRFARAVCGSRTHKNYKLHSCFDFETVFRHAIWPYKSRVFPLISVNNLDRKRGLRDNQIIDGKLICLHTYFSICHKSCLRVFDFYCNEEQQFLYWLCMVLKVSRYSEYCVVLYINPHTIFPDEYQECILRRIRSSPNVSMSASVFVMQLLKMKD